MLTESHQRVIRECFIQSLPVYLYIPSDLVDVPVSSQSLSRSINTAPPVDLDNEERAVSKIVEAISTSAKPVILVDALVARHNCTAEAHKLIDVLRCPVFVTPMGKSIVDESHPLYCGTYNGQISSPGIKEAVESSDCVIEIGPILTDCNTGGFTRDISETQLISLYPRRCEVH
jgi:pyruvate decarboxylase